MKITWKFFATALFAVNTLLISCGDADNDGVDNDDTAATTKK